MMADSSFFRNSAFVFYLFPSPPFPYNLMFLLARKRMPCLIPTTNMNTNQATLNTLPSCTCLVNGYNNNICLSILQPINEYDLYQPANKMYSVASRIWKPDGGGCVDVRFFQWSPSYINRNMKDRISAIFKCHVQAGTLYPSPLQSLTKHLSDK